ncbi:MAG: dihydrodipicolinate synthase family protein [Candidatus Hinthialibacter antarcticus]|nr:dihydrodipicolinate synthase family protein [Candidatus Hinthialibacter antarcticus]
MTNYAEMLQGVFLPITTPFKDDMSVNFGALKVNVHLYAKSGVQGFLALGSNGENRCLTEDEKRRVLETILEYKHPDQTVMTGCIYDSTPQTIEFMEFARSAGSHFATLLTPSYFRKQMTHDVLVNYFTECAGAVEIPVLLYNAPGFTGVTLEFDTVSELSKHPNIVGMKDSASSGIEKFCELNGPDFCVMPGSANFFYDAILLGSPGGVISLANVLPEAGLKLYEFAKQGDSPEGRAFHERMKSANKKISGTYGVSGVKAAMDICGKAGEWPRKPLMRLEGDDREAVKQALIESGLLP